jgi:hypothetical protein
MWPAWQLGRIRPELRGAAIADTHRLSELPKVIVRVLLPGIAIAVPVAVTILHASMPPMIQPVPNPMTLQVSEVYTESIPVMTVMLAIGLAAPAAGALAVILYAIGDLAATTLRGELVPLHWALMARLISAWLLWVLAVEIPLMGRTVAEWLIDDESSRTARRWGAVAVGATVVAATTFIWAQAAPLLIGVVFRLTAAWGVPTVAAMQPLQETGNDLVLAAEVLGMLLLAIRYLGKRPHLMPAFYGRGPMLPGGAIVGYVVGVTLSFIALYGVVTRPIDVVILLPALLVARPLARAVLRRTGAGPKLARVPMPLRFIAGFAVAAGIGWLVISIIGIQPMSGFFSMVVALALGYIVITVFVADDAALPVTAKVDTRATGGGLVTSLVLVIGPLVCLALPAIAFADNGGDHADGWPATAAAALAAAAAAALAALHTALTPMQHDPGGPPAFMGKEWTAVKKLLGGAKYEVKTQRAVVGVRG